MNSRAITRRIGILTKRCLDSWKDIAAYLQRDQRTVQRWHTKRGLPVHRIPGFTSGSVFAFREELDAWLQSTSVRNELPHSPGATPDPITETYDLEDMYIDKRFHQAIGLDRDIPDDGIHPLHWISVEQRRHLISMTATTARTLHKRRRARNTPQTYWRKGAMVLTVTPVYLGAALMGMSVWAEMMHQSRVPINVLPGYIPTGEMQRIAGGVLFDGRYSYSEYQV